ncbi:MAG: CoA-binding protein [Magnetococcales bacterium]|nr:CoA-binding protein [Magnetococcales bacterium]
MSTNSQDSQWISLLGQARVIAVVGLSPKPDRASFRVASHLQQAGYRIIPVRPMAGEILGEPCYASLDAIPQEIRVDIVDVFRRSEETESVAEEAVRIGARCLWLQSGILNDNAMAIARAAGLLAFQDLCLMVEHRRLASLLSSSKT